VREATSIPVREQNDTTSGITDEIFPYGNIYKSTIRRIVRGISVQYATTSSICRGWAGPSVATRYQGAARLPSRPKPNGLDGRKAQGLSGSGIWYQDKAVSSEPGRAEKLKSPRFCCSEQRTAKPLPRRPGGHQSAKQMRCTLGALWLATDVIPCKSQRGKLLKQMKRGEYKQSRMNLANRCNSDDLTSSESVLWQRRTPSGDSRSVATTVRNTAVVAHSNFCSHKLRSVDSRIH
jgi:hypothetical protein